MCSANDKLQAAAWCLACDPNYAARGVSNVSNAGNIELSDNLCTRLQSSCYDFVSQAASQSALLSVRSLSSNLANMTLGLQRIMANDSTGIDTLATAQDTSTSAQTAGAPSSTPVARPPDCNGTASCPWICNRLFTPQGQVNETLVSVGGQIGDDTTTTTTTSSRLLQQQIEEGSVVKNKLFKRRTLQAAEWNPDQDEAGVEVTFADDPASVDGSRLVTGTIIMSLMALLFVFMA